VKFVPLSQSGRPLEYRPEDFRLRSEPSLPGKWEGEVRAPSNIALVKYWGKKGLQVPMNPSLSFILRDAVTFTSATAERIPPADEVRFTLRFEGRPAPAFEPKIHTFFRRILPYSPWIRRYRWEIHSRNNFPHSAGIASSASAFAALALLVVQLEKEATAGQSDEYWRAKASFLARLGSGSASRSITDRIGIWGKHPAVPGSSDFYAVEFPFGTHPAFDDLRDLVLLLQEGRKAVSSTAGHQLMEAHPYREARIRQANTHLARLIDALRTGNWDEFGTVTEAEALSLHALMMASDPSFILMNPDTLKWIEKIRRFRRRHDLPVYFTLDAGANLHVIFPARIEDDLRRRMPDLFDVPHLLSRL